MPGLSGKHRTGSGFHQQWLTPENWGFFLTWALVSLRVALRYGAPGISGTLPSLGPLWVGSPIVVGAPRGVWVPHRPGIITVTSLGETRETKREWQQTTESSHTPSICEKMYYIWCIWTYLKHINTKHHIYVCLKKVSCSFSCLKRKKSTDWSCGYSCMKELKPCRPAIWQETYLDIARKYCLMYAETP